MTTADIERVQIIATCKDGQRLLAVSKHKLLIRVIAEWCQFARLREELFEECSLKEIINYAPENHAVFSRVVFWRIIYKITGEILVQNNQNGYPCTAFVNSIRYEVI